MLDLVCSSCAVQSEGLVGAHSEDLIFAEPKQTKGFDSRVVCLVGHLGDAQVLLSLWKTVVASKNNAQQIGH
jgi:hypothetical protein